MKKLINKDPKKDILKPLSNDDFTSLAIKIFHYQAEKNHVYSNFIKHLKIKPQHIKQIEDIPFLPIEFFKSHKIYTENKEEEIIFTSSGTTGSSLSRHFVACKDIYIKSFNLCFEYFYGPAKDYCFLALLPSYLERSGSSLIFMAQNFIKQSQNPLSGFFINDHKKLAESIKVLEKSGQKTILIGVSYALMDFIKDFPQKKLNHTTIIETGGMKGRRKEISKEELHNILKDGFGVDVIHSEYGMTELLSQAYSGGEGVFHCPSHMKVIARDRTDPFQILKNEKTGGINIIDLANIYSCSFIATEDLGKVYSDGSFEILGRFDSSDIRGCNLMIE